MLHDHFEYRVSRRWRRAVANRNTQLNWIWNVSHFHYQKFVDSECRWKISTGNENVTKRKNSKTWILEGEIKTQLVDTCMYSKSHRIESIFLLFAQRLSNISRIRQRKKKWWLHSMRWHRGRPLRRWHTKGGIDERGKRRTRTDLN